MVTLGVDAHKHTHTLAAADEVGRKLGERTVAATTEGHLEVVAWAARWADRRRIQRPPALAPAQALPRVGDCAQGPPPAHPRVAGGPPRRGRQRRGRIARELVARCLELTARTNALERELDRLVRSLAPGL